MSYEFYLFFSFNTILTHTNKLLKVVITERILSLIGNSLLQIKERFLKSDRFYSISRKEISEEVIDFTSFH